MKALKPELNTGKCVLKETKYEEMTAGIKPESFLD
jgi:hypothetical protein